MRVMVFIKATATVIISFLTVEFALARVSTDAKPASFPQSTIVGFPSPVTLPSATEAKLQVERREKGGAVRLTLKGDVLFDFDESDLRPDADVYLQNFFDAHKDDLSGRSIVIEGHTDSIGSHAYNQRLSQARARTIAGWIARRRALEVNKVFVFGFGESRPRVPNAHPDGRDDPAGRQRNRRVEIVVR